MVRAAVTDNTGSTVTGTSFVSINLEEDCNGDIPRLNKPDPSIGVFPNPAKELVEIDLSKLPLTDYNTVNINIFDSSGRLHLSEMIALNDERIYVDIRKLPEGILNVELQIDSKIFTIKIIKAQ